MYVNLALFPDLMRSSEDILDGKLDRKIYFFAECWFIIVLMEPRIAYKSL